MAAYREALAGAVPEAQPVGSAVALARLLALPHAPLKEAVAEPHGEGAAERDGAAEWEGMAVGEARALPLPPMKAVAVPSLLALAACSGESVGPAAVSEALPLPCLLPLAPISREAEGAADSLACEELVAVPCAAVLEALGGVVGGGEEEGCNPVALAEEEPKAVGVAPCPLALCALDAAAVALDQPESVPMGVAQASAVAVSVPGKSLAEAALLLLEEGDWVTKGVEQEQAVGVLQADDVAKVETPACCEALTEAQAELPTEALPRAEPGAEWLEKELCEKVGDAQIVGVAEAQAAPLPLLLSHSVTLALSVVAAEPVKCAVAVLLLVLQNEPERLGGGVSVALALAKAVLGVLQVDVGGGVSDATALRVVSGDVEGPALASSELERTAVGVTVSDGRSDGEEVKEAQRVARAVGEAQVETEAVAQAEPYSEGLSVPVAHGQGVGLGVAHSLTATVGVGELLGHADALL